MHIEFVGLSGSGKSTICQELSKDTDLIYAKDLIAYPLWFESSGHNKLIKKLMALKWDLYEEGVKSKLFLENKDCMREYIKNLENNRKHNNKRAVELLLRTCAIYEYCKGKEINLEHLCMDEGFYQRACSITIRNNYELPREDYFDCIPSPRIIVHVDTNSKLLQRRVKSRDGRNYELDTIRKDKEAINKILNEFKIDGCDIVKISNNNEIEGAIEKVRKGLSSIDK